ncbi:MAG TPA: DUF5700 domain-containing putative Zn-dependent protease [Pyrinomonadaceae bacterium]|nr:DUF5700 domain-containing putative Zn-dependent protease [Pyrinomonadaceae bacterium]
MKPRKLICCLMVLVSFCISGSPSICTAQTASPAVSVRLITDEPEAVLSILGKRKAKQEINEDDWRRLFQSEGYVRLKRRELGMKRSFEEADFKAFVLSDGLLERAPALAQTLTSWKEADMSRAARLALAYLPKGTRISAKIYPEIKPRENSFVYDIDTDPAIFLYLDPKMTKAELENHVAHEMHHIGYGTACTTKQPSGETDHLQKNARAVLTWLGAFGEGFATLAAAGGPDVHPHATSPAEERARWDQDAGNFNGDLKKLEQFFLDVLESRLTGDDVEKTARTFYGVQGPWYTVGWRMAALIEKTYGRARLIECMCDVRKLLLTYNQAAARHNRRSADKLALWSESLAKRVESSK